MKTSNNEVTDDDSGNVTSNFLEETTNDLDNDVENVHSRCDLSTCRGCRASIAYIGGFYTMSIGKILKCDECKDALETNEEDPCTDSSLIDA